MFGLYTQKQVRKLIKISYENGFTKGMNTGRELQYAADHNKGAIVAAQVEKEIEAIMERKRF